MSFKIPVAYIDVRVFAHATEDLEKVQTAANNVLSSETAENLTFKKSSLTGHHGNPIVLLETRIKEKRTVQGVLEKLSSGLGIFDKGLLSKEIGQHLEKGNLYIRLDKQSALQNEFKFSSSDPIHFKIHFKINRLEDIVDTCRRFGLLP